jgi:hypothetical protein
MSAVYQRRSSLARSCLACLACLAGVTTSLVAGCAPLVSYDGFRGEQSADGGDAGGDEGDASPNIDGGPADGPLREGGDDACKAAVPGVYCGRVIPGYSGGTQDLVRCLGDGTTGSITPCSNGCSSMPDGRQDVCNPCAGHADGTYCVHDLVLDYSGNDVIVTCKNDAPASATLCPLVCTASACR